MGSVDFIIAVEAALATIGVIPARRFGEAFAPSQCFGAPFTPERLPLDAKVSRKTIVAQTFRILADAAHA